MVKKFTTNGSEIKRRRNDNLNDMPQKLLAQKCGISEKTVQRIENANYPISLTLLHKMGTALGAKIDEIAYGVGRPTLVGKQDRTSVHSHTPGPASLPETTVIPRHTTSRLDPVLTAQALYELAQGSQEIIPHVLIDVPATQMAIIYECLTLLKAVSDRQWFLDDAPVAADAHDTAEFPDISRRTRLAELFVLIKGHDIRLVAEREIYHNPGVSPRLEGLDFCFQLLVGFAPPRAEYEEEYVTVPFDAGREVVLPSESIC